MTEREWLSCSDPEPMLEFLRGKASERKLRLFACACCRRMSELTFESECWAVLEVIEVFADGHCGDTELAHASGLADSILLKSPLITEFSMHHPAEAFRDAASFDEPAPPDFGESRAFRMRAFDVSEAVACSLAAAAGLSPMSNEWDDYCDTERVSHCKMLHDIIGNPFHPITIDRSWLTWNDGTIPKVAERIYDERNFDDMNVLADALEEAGCTNTDILSHCRGPGPHVRGCWVLDLMLGKA